MAATTTAKLIQVRPNHHRLNTFRLLSSSSSTPTPPPPPPQSDDNKPPPEPNSSGSQFSSYFNDVKSTLKQSQQQMNPSSFRPFPAPDSPPPAQKLPSLEEIGKTLSGFRHRTVPSSTPAGNQPPSSSQQISFQDILKRNLNSSGLQGGSPLPNDEKPGTPKFSSIRESLNQLKLTTAANNPKLTKSMAEYQQSVRLRLHPNDHPGRIDSDSNKVIGGTDPLPLVVVGKELGFAEDYPAMRAEFVKDYKVVELVEKLKSPRPEKKKGENKELEMEKGNNGPMGDMKNVLLKLKASNQDKIRKESNGLQDDEFLDEHE